MPAASAPAPAPASAPSMPPMPSPRPRSPPANALAPKGPAFVRLRAYDLLAPNTASISRRSHLFSASCTRRPASHAGVSSKNADPISEARVEDCARGRGATRTTNPLNDFSRRPSHTRGRRRCGRRLASRARARSRRFGSLARVSSDERTVRDSTSTTTCLGRPARSTDPRRFTSPASRRSPTSKTSPLARETVARRARRRIGSRDTSTRPARWISAAPAALSARIPTVVTWR